MTRRGRAASQRAWPSAVLLRRWIAGLQDQRERLFEQASDWWEAHLLEQRDRLRDRSLRTWETLVLDRRDRVRERVALTWETAVLERRDHLRDRVSARREDPAEISRRLAAGIVLAAAAVGTVLAIVAGPPDAGPAAGARTEPPAARPSVYRPFAGRLATTVDVLRLERRAGRRRLSTSRSSRGQASAAASLAGAYRSAAVNLGPPAAGRGGEAEAATLRALRRVAAAYRALADAARVADANRFSSTRDRIARADATVRRALRRLGSPSA